MPLHSWRTATGGALRCAALALLCLNTLEVLRLNAQSAEPTEYQVKAAFLFNFAKFVEWPDANVPTAQTPLALCIVGDDPFGSDLGRVVAGQLVRGQAIQIRKYRFGEDLRSCPILFIGASERAHLLQVLAAVQGAHVLTVSDLDGFAESGGVMQFVIEDSRVHFVINRAAADHAGLRISSKLLALARVVHGPAAPGR